MKHEEFEKQMFSRVNVNYKMKELNRQEIARAAAEEYRFVRKCKKINAIIGIVTQAFCFAVSVFAVILLNHMGEIPTVVGIAVAAAVGLLSGMSIQSLVNRTKK